MRSHLFELSVAKVDGIERNVGRAITHLLEQKQRRPTSKPVFEMQIADYGVAAEAIVWESGRVGIRGLALPFGHSKVAWTAAGIMTERHIPYVELSLPGNFAECHQIIFSELVEAPRSSATLDR